MKWERCNKNSPAQQAKARGVRMFYSPSMVPDQRGKPTPFRMKDYAQEALETHAKR